MHKHEVTIPARKTNRRITLTYIERPVGARQRRLQGRVTLMPDIDLGAFRTRAVIDWLEVRFSTVRETQWKWVFDRIEKATGQRCHTHLLDLGHVFRVRFQEPDPDVVLAAIKAIRDDMGIDGDVLVDGLEISIDFTPGVPGDDDQRLKLLAALVRHFMPNRNVVTGRRDDRPRFAWDAGRQATSFLFPKPGRSRKMDPLMFNELDLSPCADATLYYGRKSGECLWRIMDKVIDRQNRETGTARNLADDEKRVRIEVSLKGSELDRLGLLTLDDLLRFRFTMLTGYFRFLLPTFVDRSALLPGHMTSVRLRRDDERVRKFTTTGVVGLHAMDGAWSNWRRQQRKDMRALFRSRKIPLANTRVAKGSMQTFVAYADLNDRVKMALEKLTQRVCGQSGI